MTNEQPAAAATERARGASYVESALAAVAEPFKGVTTDGSVIPGLFSVEQTGVSTAPLKQAAEAFLASLSPEQRSATMFPIDAEEWRKWSNIHRTLMRHGMCFLDMTADQRDAAFDLLAEGLSFPGFEAVLDIMKLNYTIGEMTGRMEEFGDMRYWLSIMGTPSDDEPWGWQMDGHHVNINYFVLGDQVVMTPTFLGSEPTFAEEGKYAGTRVFAAEEQAGLTLMRSLTREQQAKALISPDMPGEMYGTAFRDNLELGYAGIRYPELRPVQQRQLIDIINVYVGKMRPGHAELKLEEVKRHLADTYFAWLGSFLGDESVFYYRVQSPVILIEFDHQRGTALESPLPSRNHIHTVVRTPNGNDYGKDLLRQHYEQHHHA